MKRPLFGQDGVGLQADFYLLVLAAVYHADGLWGEASFELTSRRIPRGFGYMIAGGVNEAVDAIINTRFSSEEIRWLRGLETFFEASEGFWEMLANYAFMGDIFTVPEGTPIFPGEPIVRVTAPLIQATLAETRLLQCVSHGVAVASSAARMVGAAEGLRVFDFGSRHVPGFEAANLVSRAAIVGGFYGTSNTQAAAVLDVPTMGTLSPGFMAAYGDEHLAIEAFHVHFPQLGYLAMPHPDLRRSVQLLSAHKDCVRVLRLNRRDLIGSSQALRVELDKAGMERVRILGSGGLDELRIAELVQAKAPVDLLAVGRQLLRTNADPSLTYRPSLIWRGPDAELVTHRGGAKLPGIKQVMRMVDHDLICDEGEVESIAGTGGMPLLEPVVLRGRRVKPVEPVEIAQSRCRLALEELPEGVRALRPTTRWPVMASMGLGG